VLLAEDGTIIAGHGRVLAARKLRIKDIPVMVAAGWTEAQKRAYAMGPNARAIAQTAKVRSSVHSPHCNSDLRL
jgi:hypothetical protein